MTKEFHSIIGQGCERMKCISEYIRSVYGNKFNFAYDPTAGYATTKYDGLDIEIAFRLFAQKGQEKIDICLYNVWSADSWEYAKFIEQGLEASVFNVDEGVYTYSVVDVSDIKPILDEVLEYLNKPISKKLELQLDDSEQYILERVQSDPIYYCDRKNAHELAVWDGSVCEGIIRYAKSLL